MKTLTFSLIASATVQYVAGAGFTTHNIAARRATEFERFTDEETETAFAGLNRYRVDALQGGAPFPDYLYACGDDHNAGEEAHWTPFQQAAAAYVRDTYPSWIEDGRDSDGAGLVAFMSGVVSHYIVDENWHGLCTGCDAKGLIKNIGYADFNCTGDLCSTAHTATDTGGEFVGANQMDVSWYPDQNWYIPVQDLVNIFQQMNNSCYNEPGSLSYCPQTKPYFIRECSVVFYAGSWAVSTFGNLVYPIVATRLGEFLTSNRYVDHTIGGVDDDSAWTAFMQARWANWVYYGPPTSCTDCGEKDPLETMLDNRVEDPPFEAKRSWMHSMKKAFKEFGEGNLPFRVSQVGEHGAINIHFELDLKEESKHELLLKRLARIMIYDFLDVVESPKGGWLTEQEKLTLETILFNKVDQLMNKPGAFDESTLLSQVLKEQEEEDLVHVNPAFSQTSLLQGGESHQQLGYALDSADVDQDGCMDMIVGSPGYSSSGHPQSGKAEIYLCPSGSDSSMPYASSSSSSKVVVLSSYTNETQEVYERFGATVKFANLNGDDNLDAIVCSPSWGGENIENIVGNYTGYCSFFLGPFDTNVSNSPRMPDKVVFGDRPWGVFGEQVIVGDVTGDGVDDVIISAPQAGSDDNIVTNQGMVYVIEPSTTLFAGDNQGPTMFTATEASTHVITSTSLRQHFGWSLEIGLNGTLLVGAPFYHIDGDSNGAVGKVFAYDLKQVADGTSTVDPVFTITGCRHGSRIGGSFAMNHKTGLLALSEVGYNNTDDYKKTHLRSGRVHFIDFTTLQVSSNNGNTTNFNFCEDGGDFDQIVLKSIEPKDADFDGDGSHLRVKKFAEARFGYRMLWNANNDALAISSPGALSNAGGLFIYHLVNQSSSSISEGADTFMSCIYNEVDYKSYGRFGQSFTWFDQTQTSSSNAKEEGSLTLVVGVPRSSLGLHQAPDLEELGEIKLITSKILV